MTSTRFRSALVAIMISVALSRCAHEALPAPARGFGTEAQCPEVDGEPDYLLRGAVGSPPFWEERLKDEINPFFAAANEPRLWCGSDNDRAYRFLWLPSYAPAMLIRISEHDEKWLAHTTTFVDPRSNEKHIGRLFTLDKQKTIEPSSNAIEKMLQAAAAAGLWTMASWKQSTETSDGAKWVLELRDAGGYRVITRANVPEPKVEALARALFVAAESPIPLRLAQ